jgi:hypothetical protein
MLVSNIMPAIHLLHSRSLLEKATNLPTMTTHSESEFGSMYKNVYILRRVVSFAVSDSQFCYSDPHRFGFDGSGLAL